MGLDMYLHKVYKEEVAYWRKANAIHDWFDRLYQEQTGSEEELGDCQTMYVSKEDLQKLKEDCQKVLNSSKLVYKEVPVRNYDFDKKEYVTTSKMKKVLDDTSVAEKVLPTRSGFFFGDTDYDEYYVDDLKETIEQIDKILEEVDFGNCTLEYHAWW